MPPSPRLPVHAPPPSYSRSPSYRVFNSISIVLNIMRLFVFFEFHDRMGLVTKTIARVWTDMCKATAVLLCYCSSPNPTPQAIHIAPRIMLCSSRRSFYSPQPWTTTDHFLIIFVLSVVMLSFLGWNLLGADSPDFRDFFWTLQART